MKIGGLRGDILFKSKEYPLALPKKDSRGDFVFPPGTPLKRPKEGLRPFLWKPFRSLREFFERRARALRCELTGDIGTWDESWKLWRLWSFRALRFAENEVGDSPADLEPGIGRSSPQPSAYSPPFCRGRALSRPAWGCWELRWPSDVRPVPRRPRLPCVKGAVAALPRLRDCPRLLDTFHDALPSLPSTPQTLRSAPLTRMVDWAFPSPRRGGGHALGTSARCLAPLVAQ